MMQSVRRHHSRTECCAALNGSFHNRYLVASYSLQVGHSGGTIANEVSDLTARSLSQPQAVSIILTLNTKAD
jgi:hypothetical protein